MTPLLLAAALLGGMPAYSAAGPAVAAVAPAADHVSLARVVAELSKHTPGRLLDAQFESGPGGEILRVRWLTESGRRQDFLLDATSGAILDELR